MQGNSRKNIYFCFINYTKAFNCMWSQSCLTLCDFRNYSPPDSSAHRIFQARILEWIDIPFSRGYSWPRDWTQVFCIAGRFFTNWATWEVWLCGSQQTGKILNIWEYLLRNLYAGQEAKSRTGHGIMDWFQIEKEVCQVCILSPCLFNLYAECIMGNARLFEAQAGIKIARRNFNNLRYEDETSPMAESERN